MRAGCPIVLGVVLCATVAVTSASAAPSGNARGNQSSTLEPVSSTYDDATGLWFNRRADASGRITQEVKGKDLLVTKQFADGQLTVEVKSGKQGLWLAVGRNQVEIRSGKRRVKFDPSRATEEDYHAAKELLAHSRVVGKLRAAAAGVGSSLVNAPEGFEFLLTDAVVAVLDGDPAAARRLRDRLQERLLGMGIQPAAAGTIGFCYDEWRTEVYNAMMDMRGCVDDFEVWNVPMRNLCYFEWTLRVEGAWFEYVGCTLSRAVRLG